MIVYDKLPATTRAKELRIGDVQIFGGCKFRITSTNLSKSGRTLNTEVMHDCDPETPCNRARYGGYWAIGAKTWWGRQVNASAQRVIRRPRFVIEELPA